jgi:hypothetical protein
VIDEGTAPSREPWSFAHPSRLHRVPRGVRHNGKDVFAQTVEESLAASARAPPYIAVRQRRELRDGCVTGAVAAIRSSSNLAQRAHSVPA